MDLSDDFQGFRTGIGESVPDDHFIAKAVTREPAYARWLDARYVRVFKNPHFKATRERLDRLRRDLASVKGFAAADAEVQAAATILNVEGAVVEAQTEGDERAADFVAVLGESKVDVEVKLLREDDDEREIDTTLDSIRKRLENVDLGADLWVTLQVRRVRDESDQKILDSGAEARLVTAVRSAVNDASWRSRPVRISLRADGKLELCTQRTSWHGELASVELRLKQGLKRPFVYATTGMSAATESDRVYAALKRKGARKQREGNRPWVIVLDSSQSMLMDREELEAGAQRRFQDTKGSLSAVAVQRRALLSYGLGFAEDDWIARFTSFVVPNENATFPLSEAELKLFREEHAQVVKQKERRRPRRGSPGGGLVGAVLGSSLPGRGAGLGDLATEGEIMTLEEALREALAKRGLTLLSLTRESALSVAILFEREPNKTWTLSVSVPLSTAPKSAAALDDALYDRALVEADAWLRDHPASQS